MEEDETLDTEEQERTSRDKFKREREDDTPKESSPPMKKERNSSLSPDSRGRKREKYDDFGRISRDKDNSSPERERTLEKDAPVRDEDRNKDRPERGRSGDRFDSYRPGPNRGFRRNRGEGSPERGRGRRDSPPMKRRRNEWPNRGYRDHRDIQDRDRYNRTDYQQGSRDRDTRYNRDSWRDEDKEERPKVDLYSGGLKTLKQFADIQGEESSQPEVERKYQSYQDEWKNRQSKTFFEEHKTEEWFKEKYDPSYLEKKRISKIEMATTAFKSFLSDIAQGTTWSLSATDNPEHVADIPQPEEIEQNEGEQKVTPKDDKAEEKHAASQKPASSVTGCTTLFVKTIPPSCGKNDLLHVLETTSGFLSLTLSEPLPYKNFHRMGWANYDTPQHCAKAVADLNGRKLKDFELMVKPNKPSEEKVKMAPPVACEEERIKIDLEMTSKLIQQLDTEKGIEHNPLTAPTAHGYSISGPDPTQFKNKEPQDITEALDQRITYLRRVHSYCYYCGEEYDDLLELQRKCASKHLRGKKKDTTNPIDVSTEPWAVSLDQKTKHRLDVGDNPNEYTAKNSLDRGLDKFNAEKVSKINDEKYRCGLCFKLFAGDHFVKKHLALKHEKEIEDLKKQILEEQFLANYMNDPKKLLPTTSAHNNSQNRGPPPIAVDRPPRDVRGGDRQGRHISNPVEGSYAAFRRGRNDRPKPSRQNQRYNRGDFRDNRPYNRPSQTLEPPPGVEQDPRAIREYVDLDAPQEDEVHIDYRMSAPLPDTNE